MSFRDHSQQVTNQLIAAIGADDVEKLQALFKTHRININAEIPSNIRFYDEPVAATSLMHIAVHANSHNVIKWLIEQKIDLNARTEFSGKEDFTALAFAGNLLNNGGPPEQLNESIGILLEAGADPQGLLMQCVRGKNLAGARRAVEAGADVNGDDGDRHGWGWKVLHHAAYNGDTAMIEYLIAQGAHVNARHTDIDKSTPLMLATSKGHPAAMRLLLQHAADPGLLHKKGTSIFFNAARTTQNTDEVLDILLEQREKLDPNLLNRRAPVDRFSVWSDKTPLTYAIASCPAELSNPSTVAAFIRHGADWRELDADGQSILHRLIPLSEEPGSALIMTLIIRNLLKAGVDPFLQNKHGVTAYEAARSVPVILDIFRDHCKPLRYRAWHFDAAADPLLDAAGKPTGLLWYLCLEDGLESKLQPYHWAGQEKALLATKLAIAKALPEAHVKKYDAILDPTALRRNIAPKPDSWLKRYTDTPPEDRGRNE